jgi:hypothetical protein
VRWRCADLRDHIAAKFNVHPHNARWLIKPMVQEAQRRQLLKKLNFSMSARPVHQQSDLEAQEAFIKRMPAPVTSDFVIWSCQSATTYPVSGP